MLRVVIHRRRTGCLSRVQIGHSVWTDGRTPLRRRRPGPRMSHHWRRLKVETLLASLGDEDATPAAVDTKPVRLKCLELDVRWANRWLVWDGGRLADVGTGEAAHSTGA